MICQVLKTLLKAQLHIAHINKSCQMLHRKSRASKIGRTYGLWAT